MTKKKAKGQKQVRFRPPAYKLPDTDCSERRFLTPDDPDSNGNYVMLYSLDSMVKSLLSKKSRTEPPGVTRPDLFSDAAVVRASETFMNHLVKLKSAISYEQAAKLDAIDARQMSYAIKSDENLALEHVAYLFQTNSILHIVPCFTEGILYEIQETVVHWKILNLDLEHDTFTVQLTNYFLTDKIDNNTNLWIMSSRQTVTISAIPDTETDFTYEDENGVPCRPIQYRLETKPEDIIQQNQLMRALNQQTIGLTPSEKYSFNIIFRDAADWFAADCMECSGIAPFLHAEYSFLYVMGGVNMFLNRKPARKPAANFVSSLPTPSGRKSGTNHTASTPPEKTVRVIDMLTFISEATPRKPTLRNVARYLTPEWQVRGHIRTYKSGKQAYIRPHINKRRKPPADTSTGNRPQQIIRIRDNTDATLENKENLTL